MALAKAQTSFVTVGFFCNETKSEMTLFLEMIAFEVVLSPGHTVELLALPSEALLPVTIDIVDKGLQIHPHKEFDPGWHVRFGGKVIRVTERTVLAEHE